MVTALPVGSPLRRRIAAALLAATICGAACLLLAVVATQDKALRAHSPWQDDPYDVVVSFSMLTLPALLAAGALRVPSCRAAAALPVTRARDLTRLARLVTGVAAVSAATDWAAVAAGAHAAAWGAQGRWLIAVLGVVSALAGAAWVLTARVLRSPDARGWRGAEGPDWIDDWLALGRRAAAHAAIATRLLAFAERRVVAGRWGVRRHPLAAAAVTAACCGLAVAASQVIGEHAYTRLAVAVKVLVAFAVIVASGMFAFLVGAGYYLRLVRPAPAPVGADPRRGRRVLLYAGLAAAASVPVTVAFRGLAGPAGDRFTGLLGLIAVVAALVWVTAALVTNAIQPTSRHRRQGRPAH